MRSSLKKAIAALGIAGALSLGGASIANAATTTTTPLTSEISISATTPVIAESAHTYATIPDVSGLSISDAITTYENAGFTNVQAAPGVSIGEHNAVGSVYQPGEVITSDKLIVIYAAGL